MSDGIQIQGVTESSDEDSLRTDSQCPDLMEVPQTNVLNLQQVIGSQKGSSDMSSRYSNQVDEYLNCPFYINFIKNKSSSMVMSEG